MNAPKLASSSFVWQSIIWGRDILYTGTRWRIDNGASVSIYRDNWLPKPPDFKIISQYVLGINTTVDSLLSPSGIWDSQLIKRNFVKDDADKILSIPVGPGGHNDTQIWHYKISDNYSVKSGYRAGQNLVHSPSTSYNNGSINWWKNLWKTDIPIKIKIFVWKA
ncbi:hypothetical protein Dsin_020699 [Dipteronia sinensis]|uniref:Uncharacterized protein n=1 Tax=Dipteronia sinensis TaxID=43782 RepID=A0AAE0E410_9ROSI|nr:hypothetical protein Dsin_020699 [Dipteronia sinensis]